MVVSIETLSKLKQNDRIEFLSRLNLIRTGSISGKVYLSLWMITTIVLATSGRFFLSLLAWAIGTISFLLEQSKTSKKETELSKEFFNFNIEGKRKK